MDKEKDYKKRNTLKDPRRLSKLATDLEQQLKRGLSIKELLKVELDEEEEKDSRELIRQLDLSKLIEKTVPNFVVPNQLVSANSDRLKKQY